MLASAVLVERQTGVSVFFIGRTPISMKEPGSSAVFEIIRLLVLVAGARRQQTAGDGRVHIEKRAFAVFGKVGARPIKLAIVCRWHEWFIDNPKYDRMQPCVLQSPHHIRRSVQPVILEISAIHDGIDDFGVLVADNTLRRNHRKTAARCCRARQEHVCRRLIVVLWHVIVC